MTLLNTLNEPLLPIVVLFFPCVLSVWPIFSTTELLRKLTFQYQGNAEDLTGTLF